MINLIHIYIQVNVLFIKRLIQVTHVHPEEHRLRPAVLRVQQPRRRIRAPHPQGPAKVGTTRTSEGLTRKFNGLARKFKATVGSSGGLAQRWFAHLGTVLFCATTNPPQGVAQKRTVPYCAKRKCRMLLIISKCAEKGLYCSRK